MAFSRDMIIILIVVITFIPSLIFFLSRILKYKDDKEKRKKYATMLAIFYVVYFSIPIEKIVNQLPVNLNNIETAFKFDYNDMFNKERYSLLFKKKYKNTYFVVGRRNIPTGPSLPEEFNCYYKNKNGWRPVLEPFTCDITYGENDGYDIYYCNNTKDKVTGIFVTIFPSSKESKKGLEITDKYKTEFNYITDDNKKPIKYFNKTNKIYFGVMDHNITDEYYIKVNGKKIYLENK